MILWSRITWKVSKTRTQKRKRNEMWKYLLEMFLRNEESNEQEVQNMEPADWIKQVPGGLNSFCEMLRRRGSWAFKFNLSTYIINTTPHEKSFVQYLRTHCVRIRNLTCSISDMLITCVLITVLYPHFSWSILTLYDGVVCTYKNDSLFCHFS